MVFLGIVIKTMTTAMIHNSNYGFKNDFDSPIPPQTESTKSEVELEVSR